LKPEVDISRLKKKSYKNASNFNQQKISIGSRGLSNKLSFTESLDFLTQL